MQQYLKEKIMKNMRQLCAAAMLTLTLALHASAGQMETPITPPPPPSATAEGQMTTGSSEAVNSVTDIALSLLQNLLPLF
jgi:hypothetical protein